MTIEATPNEEARAATEVSTGADCLARILHGYGVSHVFFMDAILRRSLAAMGELGVTRVLTHSEKGAAYMADGYARVSHRPGICFAQSVGAANLAAGLQDPHFAQSSVIAITGRQIASNQYRNAYQELPHDPLFAPVTKWSARIEEPAQLGPLLRQAFRETTSGTPGPVHLDIAGHTGHVSDNWSECFEVQVEPQYASVPAWRPRADPCSLELARVAISQAWKPVLVIGRGAMISRAEAAVRHLAELASIPVAASLDAKAILPATHPLNAGVVGTYSADCANRIVSEADLVVFVGCDTGDQVTSNWNIPRQGVKAVQIDINPSELGRNYPGAIGVWADPRSALEELACALSPVQRTEWTERLTTLVSAWSALNEPLTNSAESPIRPERLCAELGAWLPEDAILVADTGYSSHWTGTLVQLRSPCQTYLRAAGSLGWGFPAALGAKCAAPERPVVCFTGDGGFMYHLPELETASRWGLNTITVVNNNHRLAQGTRSLNLAYEGYLGSKDDLFVYEEQDFAKHAENFGCVGIRVTDPRELSNAFDRALASARPAVIDVVTEPGAFARLPWSAG